MRILVQFGDTRFLHDRRLFELPSDNFAAEPIAGFKDRDVTLPRRALLQEKRTHQSTQPAADYGDPRLAPFRYLWV